MSRHSPPARLLIAATLFLALLPAFARAQVETHAQQWTLAMIQGRLAGDLRGYLEIQPRTELGPGDLALDRLLIRPAVWYPVANGLSLWLGYCAIGAFQPTTSWEHRSWQQAQHESDQGAWILVNRTRLEERFLPGASSVGFRLRHLARVAIPLDDRRVWSAVVFNELMVNFNSPTAAVEAGFDQNRAFAGISWSVAPGLRLEGGYMNNYVVRPAPSPDRMNHIPYLLMSYTL
jgi:hypothetical protein